MAHGFSDFCKVYLGFKSFLNDFFYVDADTIEKFGIEKKFLVPLLQLGDLDPDKYLQEPEIRRWLFRCKQEPADIRGTGAYDYIRWGAKQYTTLKKQTKEPVYWKDAPALSHQKHWFWPAAPVHPATLAVRKGIGERYAPFIFERPAVLDQRLYLLWPIDVSIEMLTAYVASSLFPLALETDAGLGLGAGVLTLSTDGLRALPCVDLAKVAASPAAGDVIKAAKALLGSPVPDAREYPTHKGIRALDEAFMVALGMQKKKAREVEEQVAHLAHVRIAKAGMRKTETAAASRADVEAFASTIADRLEKWLVARAFPDDFIGAAPSFGVDLPQVDLIVGIDIFFGKCGIQVTDEKGQTLYKADFHPAVAELFVRCLQMRKRRFQSPQQPEDAIRVLGMLEDLLNEFEGEFTKEFSQVSVGAKHEEEVRRLVLDKLNMPLDQLRAPFEHGQLQS